MSSLPHLKQAQVCSFGSTARWPDKIESDPNLNALLKAETPIITIFGKTWQLHSEKGLGLEEDENAELIERSVAFLVKEGKRVIFDAEHFYDGYKTSPSFALKMLDAAQTGGADTLVLCDTNGGTLPEFIQDATKVVVKKLESQIGVHVHNDGGLATANTLSAVIAGANLEGANLDWAILWGTDLTGANMAEARLHEATADTDTRWPDGFDPVAAGVAFDLDTAHLTPEAAGLVPDPVFEACVTTILGEGYDDGSRGAHQGDDPVLTAEEIGRAHV